MLAKSTSLLSRFANLSSPGLLALTILAAPAPAHAVAAASSGEWRFALYEDTGCEGDFLDTVFSSSYKEVDAPDLRDVSFNDVTSSWSFCNGLTKTVLASFTLYTGVSYAGTAIPYVVSVPSGACVTKNSLTSDNAVSSFKLLVATY